jgi:multidrug efflux pump subunit AcrB
VVFTGYLYVIIPKGLFPQQDTGLIISQSEAAQDISFQAMAERQQALLNAAMRDPAVASIGSAVGAGVVERVVDRVGQDAVARGDIALDRDVEHTDVTTDQFNAEPFSSNPTTNVTRSTR